MTLMGPTRWGRVRIREESARRLKTTGNDGKSRVAIWPGQGQSASIVGGQESRPVRTHDPSVGGSSPPRPTIEPQVMGPDDSGRISARGRCPGVASNKPDTAPRRSRGRPPPARNTMRGVALCPDRPHGIAPGDDLRNESWKRRHARWDCQSMPASVSSADATRGHLRPFAREGS